MDNFAISNITNNSGILITFIDSIHLFTLFSVASVDDVSRKSENTKLSIFSERVGSNGHSWMACIYHIFNLKMKILWYFDITQKCCYWLQKLHCHNFIGFDGKEAIKLRMNALCRANHISTDSLSKSEQLNISLKRFFFFHSLQNFIFDDVYLIRQITITVPRVGF